MSRLILRGTAALALGLLGWSLFRFNSSDVLRQTSFAKPPEPAPLCPWREPEADLKVLFPAATRYEVETRILSGLRPELQQRLGRPPTGDENALRIFRIYRDQAPMGAVLTRRVKGEHGVIEVVLGADTDGQVSGVLFQRQREPQSVADALDNPGWRRSFEGKGASSGWRLGVDIPQVALEARTSAEAVVDGVRSLLVLLSSADHGSRPSLVSSHTH